MIDLEQIVETKWNNGMKKYYESLGYIFTGRNSKLFVKAKHLYKNSLVRVKVNCDICGKECELTYCDYNSCINNNDGLYICHECKWKMNGKEITKKAKENVQNWFYEFLEYCENNGYTPVTTIDEVHNTQSLLYYICPKHGKQKTILQYVRKNNQCIYCRPEKLRQIFQFSTEEVIQIVESKNNNKVLNPEDYVNHRTKNLNIICGMCGNTFLSSLSNIINSYGACNKCGHKKAIDQLRLTPEEIIRRYNSEETKLLNPYDYINNSTKNLNFVCSECGIPFVTRLSNYQDGYTRCKKCNNMESIGEYQIKLVLDRYKINYIREYCFEDCKDIKMLPFDFYLPDENTAIEFDGQHHFEPIFGEERFEITKKHDKIKDEYCMNNNIKLIRIPYYKGSMIEKILMEYFDLKPIVKIKYPIR